MTKRILKESPPATRWGKMTAYGVSHRVLDVAVAEVSLQRSRIVALVGQRKTTGVAQHVRMSRKA
jgi:hypothetical protein